MTELNLANKKNYLDLCREVWDLSDESLDYIDKRISDEWKPVPEIEQLIKSCKGTYEDLRLRIDLNMADKNILSIFEKSDKAYEMFLSKFRNVLTFLSLHYSVDITYKDFIENKVIFKKNSTKIKKVFETVYKEHNEIYERDFSCYYNEDDCSKSIVSAYEKISSYKKSAKKIQFVISLNPIDWLLASTSENFKSCLCLDHPEGGYRYCLGLPFLCGDKNRMMLYITDGSTKEFQGIVVDSVQTRTWCILDKSSRFTIVKWYPNNTIGVDPVKKITKNNNFISREEFDGGKYPLDVISTKKGIVASIYNDMGSWEVQDDKLVHNRDGSAQQIFTKNLIPLDGRGYTKTSFSLEGYRNLPVRVDGYRIPNWRKCGASVDLLTSTMRCVCCGSNDKGGFSVKHKDYESFYCYDCYKDNTVTCYICGESKIKTKNQKTFVNIKNKEVFICESCESQIHSYTCSCCNKVADYGLDKLENGERICKNCIIKNEYGKCDSCGKLYKNLTVNINFSDKTNLKYCEKCIADGSIVTSPTPVYGRFWKNMQVVYRGNNIE